MKGTLEHKVSRKENATRREVVSVLREVFADPDFGRAILPSFARRLRASMRSAAAGHGEDLKVFLAK